MRFYFAINALLPLLFGLPFAWNRVVKSFRKRGGQLSKAKKSLERKTSSYWQSQSDLGSSQNPIFTKAPSRSSLPPSTSSSSAYAAAALGDSSAGDETAAIKRGSVLVEMMKLSLIHI